MAKSVNESNEEIPYVPHTICTVNTICTAVEFEMLSYRKSAETTKLLQKKLSTISTNKQTSESAPLVIILSGV